MVEVDSDGNTAASDSETEYLSRAEVAVRCKVKQSGSEQQRTATYWLRKESW